MSPTLSILALAASLALGQQVFRSGTELVEVDAVVLDRDGQFVRGLTALDFELYDEGDRQDIATFAFIEVPARRAGAPFELGLSSTAAQRASAVYLIVIDNLHTPSRTANLVRQRAREFVEQHLGPSDLAAVVHLGLSAGAVEFSNSKPKLLAAIGGVKGSGGNAGANPTPGVVPTGDDGGAPDSEAFNLAGLERIERSLASERAERAFEMLGAACEYVAGFTGRRKSMLLFSEGIPIAPQDLVPGDRSELANGKAEGAGRDVASRQELIDLARRSNMSLYTIDSRGLDIGAVGVPRPGEGVEEQRLRWSFLRTIADETGGAPSWATTTWPSRSRRSPATTAPITCSAFVPARRPAARFASCGCGSNATMCRCSRGKAMANRVAAGAMPRCGRHLRAPGPARRSQTCWIGRCPAPHPACHFASRPA